MISDDLSQRILSSLSFGVVLPGGSHDSQFLIGFDCPQAGELPRLLVASATSIGS
jgi:hypothetical protein